MITVVIYKYSIEIITEWDLTLIHSTNKCLILIMCEALQGIQWKIRHGLCPQGAYSLVWKKINKHLDSHNIKEKVMCHKKESVNVLWKSLTLVDTFLKKILYCRVYIANKNKKKDQRSFWNFKCQILWINGWKNLQY